MKKIIGLTLAEIEEKWVEGATYFIQTENLKYWHRPMECAFAGDIAISNEWILELPNEKLATDTEIIKIVKEQTSKNISWFDDIELAIKLTQERERLRYKDLIDAVEAYFKTIERYREPFANDTPWMEKINKLDAAEEHLLKTFNDTKEAL